MAHQSFGASLLNVASAMIERAELPVQRNNTFITSSLRFGGASPLRAANRDAQLGALLRMAGTAFGREVGDEIGHQRQIGAVALKTPFLLHAHKTRLRHRLQVERQIRRRKIQHRCDLTRDEPLGTLPDEHPVHVKPDTR